MKLNIISKLFDIGDNHNLWSCTLSIGLTWMY